MNRHPFCCCWFFFACCCWQIDNLFSFSFFPNTDQFIAQFFFLFQKMLLCNTEQILPNKSGKEGERKIKKRKVSISVWFDVCFSCMCVCHILEIWECFAVRYFLNKPNNNNNNDNDEDNVFFEQDSISSISSISNLRMYKCMFVVFAFYHYSICCKKKKKWNFQTTTFISKWNNGWTKCCFCVY